MLKGSRFCRVIITVTSVAISPLNAQHSLADTNSWDTTLPGYGFDKWVEEIQPR